MQPPFGVLKEGNQPVRMRDGAVLMADVYRPEAAGLFPTLLHRTPYNKDNGAQLNYAHAAWYASHGFVVVVQDVRGRWASGGVFTPFENEDFDGYDSVAWAASLPYSNSNVGMYGFSYCGMAQLRAASLRPQHLKAIAPAMTSVGAYDGWLFSGGILNLAFVLGWAAFLARDEARRAGDMAACKELGMLCSEPTALYNLLPLRKAIPESLDRYAPYLRDWLDRRSGSWFWSSFSSVEQADPLLPSLHVAGWYDTFLEGTIANYRSAALTGADHHLVVGPWAHSPWVSRVGDADFGPDAVSDVDRMQLAFFRRHLDPDAADDAGKLPPVYYFMMGLNEWRSAERWPPPSFCHATYFVGGGRAVAADSGTLSPCLGTLGCDSIHCDPASPVTSLGGRSNDNPSFMGPMDQRPNEARSDVIAYTSDVLAADLSVVGSPKLTLEIDIDVPSLDLSVRLSDVDPQGRSLPVSDAALRLGGSGTCEILMSPTANCFLAGHRIRLALAGSDFPVLARNPNSGADPLDVSVSDFRVATLRVRYGGILSRIELPLG